MDHPHIHPGTMPAPVPGDESGLTERYEYKLEILPPDYIIQCRRTDIVEKNGVEIARGYFRSYYKPGDDISTACPEVQKVAAALWPTPVPLPAPEEEVDPEFGVTPEVE